MSIAFEYVRHGFVLVPFGKGLKGPREEGWQKLESCIATVEQAHRLNGSNLGLAHVYSRTCALDLDRLNDARTYSMKGETSGKVR